MIKMIIALLALSTLTQASIELNISKNLNQLELQKLANGEMVIKTKEIKEMVWPELTFYVLIPATPLESVSIFYALDHQKNYIPNLLKSDVVAQDTPSQATVEYELKLPWPLSNSRYTHGHQLEASKDLSSYKVSWWMIKSSNTEKVQGDATFQAYQGKTLMMYRSLVAPKSIFANFVESKLVKDVQKSLEATSNEIKRVKNSDRNLLIKYVSFIEDALSGKFSYLLKKK